MLVDVYIVNIEDKHDFPMDSWQGYDRKIAQVDDFLATYSGQEGFERFADGIEYGSFEFNCIISFLIVGYFGESWIYDNTDRCHAIEVSGADVGTIERYYLTNLGDYKVWRNEDVNK